MVLKYAETFAPALEQKYAKELASFELFQSNKQVKFIENNPNVDVLGTFMTEFIDDRNNKICVKDAPLERIEN